MCKASPHLSVHCLQAQFTAFMLSSPCQFTALMLSSPCQFTSFISFSGPLQKALVAVCDISATCFASGTLQQYQFSAVLRLSDLAVFDWRGHGHGRGCLWPRHGSILGRAQAPPLGTFENT